MACETDDDNSTFWPKYILSDQFPAFSCLQVLLFVRFNEISDRLCVAKMPKYSTGSAFNSKFSPGYYCI